MADNIAGQTRTPAPDQGTPGDAQGKIVFDATAIVATDDTYVQCGFRPRYIRWQASSGVNLEWFAGMAEGTAFKSDAAGARTLNASFGIKTDDRGFRVSQNVALAGILASSTCYYTATV